jgi:copper(I)-binding protein
MLMGLKHDLKPGEKVAVTLKFEHGGETRVEAPVK